MICLSLPLTLSFTTAFKLNGLALWYENLSSGLIYGFMVIQDTVVMSFILYTVHIQVFFKILWCVIAPTFLCAGWPWRAPRWGFPTLSGDSAWSSRGYTEPLVPSVWVLRSSGAPACCCLSSWCGGAGGGAWRETPDHLQGVTCKVRQNALKFVVCNQLYWAKRGNWNNF